MSPTRGQGGYMLCASPRSGSTLLCDLLTRTRVAGVPESYFRPASIAESARTWGIDDVAPDRWDRRYVEAVHEHGSGGTGRFGMRIMWSDTRAFLDNLGRVYPGDAHDVERLRVTLGVDHFVHLSRADRVAQAVSLVLAEQTGLWHRNADGSERERSAPPQVPHFDHGRIAAELHTLDEEALGWQTWFESVGVTPMTLTYDELSADPTSELARVLRYFGIVGADIPMPGTARLSSMRNDEWSARFRAEGTPRE